MSILTVQEAKEYLKQPETAELKLVVESVNQIIPELCWVTFDLHDYSEKILLRSPVLTLRLAHFPVVAMSSLTNLTGTAVTPLIEDFENGILRLRSDYWGGMTRAEDQFDAIYSAGYATVPPAVKIAALAIVEDRLEIGDSSLTKQKLGDRSFERKMVFPPLAQEILNRYSEITQ
jgi:hypothetical protein